MAFQRVWRYGIDADPPPYWPRVHVSPKLVEHGNFQRSDQRFRNISWWDNAITWLCQPDQIGAYAFCHGNRPPRYRGDDDYLFAFSDPNLAFQFKLQWC